jgi:membrane-bound metal-dependent hydrolase YbcI (DUF457 family)
MKQAVFNALGPTTHLLAGLMGLVWAVSLGWATPSLGLMMMVVSFALLPDIDSTASVVGRLAGPISTFIERRFGHRTLTHSAWFAGLVGLMCWLWFPAPDWGIILAAWLSHLIIDMIVGERGVPLLWPGSWHFYLITVRPGSAGEALVAACCALAVLYPLYAPQQAALAAQTFANATPTPTATMTATSTPQPLIIRIAHVYDIEAEILVQPGDRIESGQLLADLTTYRRYHPLPPTPVAAEFLPPPAATATSSPPPTETATPTPTATWQPNPLILADAQARLAEARLRATQAAAPVPPATLTACNDDVETLRRELWQTQLARDALMATDPETGADHKERWFKEQAYTVELGALEGQIAQAQSRCDALAAQPHAAAPVELEIAAAELRQAEIDYLHIIATPTPRLEAAPTATETPTPTRTPTPTATPTETATPTPPPEDVSRVYAKVAGVISAVEIVSISGNEMTVEISLYSGPYAEIWEGVRR